VPLHVGFLDPGEQEVDRAPPDAFDILVGEGDRRPQQLGGHVVPQPGWRISGPGFRVLHVASGDPQDHGTAVAQVLPLLCVVGDPVVGQAGVVLPAIGEDGQVRQVA
jgi:hypothetical protein